MNTISNSGRRGVSDVFSAALWTLDGSFEVAQGGGVGVNFHQGAGQNLYAAIIRCVRGTNRRSLAALGSLLRVLQGAGGSKPKWCAEEGR